MSQWADRWAVVTGASSGIGAEFARQLAARGMHIVMVARREDRMKELAEELERLHGAKSAIVPLDLVDPSAPDTLMARIDADSLDVAVLVNNAGFGQVDSIDQLDRERELACIDLNVRVLTDLTYRFLPRFRERGDGAILNVASVAGFQPVAYMPVYAAGKAFVLHFTESLWAELRGTGVAVTALCPGTTATEFFDEAGVPGWLHKQSSHTPQKVVKVGLKALEKKRPFVVPGWKNWITVNLSRFFPRKLVVLETRKYFRPKSDQ